MRRQFFAFLVVSTIAGLLATMIHALSFNGISAFEWILVSCFLITAPWTAIGFWNAVIGFFLMRFTRDPAAHVFPAVDSINGRECVTSSTALAMCIRNEDVAQVSENLNSMMARLVASGSAGKFHVYVLSDTSFDELIHEEKLAFETLRSQWADKIDLTYRRRTNNKGFKAGNIRDFCERWGDRHDFVITLDADSVMSASTILRMVRLMQKNPQLGILQSLVVGLPSDSAFTRVFQFGMRMGMRSYTLGSAWWQADCGPYWGHNAIIRMKPFIDHCHLPELAGDGPLSGSILSHDQVEAVFMRRAGFECRVIAEETGSYEENPPHLLEFIRRDLRWCHGNMQYFKLLNEKGLLPTSRMQLVLAIMMFISAPAWMLFVVLATMSLVIPGIGLEMQAGFSSYALFWIIMGMIFAPKFVSIADVLVNNELRKSFGGGGRVVFGAASEIVFSMLLAPVMAIANTIFLFKLFVLGQAKGWVQQRRKSHALPLQVTLSHLWPQMVFGLTGMFLVFSYTDASLPVLAVCLPVFVGPAFVVPLALSSSHPFFGELAARLGVWQLPEEETPPVIVRALNSRAVELRSEERKLAEIHSPLTTQQLLDLDVELDDVPGRRLEPAQVVA